MRRLIAVWCLALLLSLTRPAQCTQSPRIAPGSRIRFDAANLGAGLTGRMVRLEPTALVVALDGDAPGLAVMIPTDSVSALAVHHERRMVAEGLLIGSLAGVAVGALASPDWVDDDGNCTILCRAYDVSPNVDTRMAVLGLAGALVGTIIGAGTKTSSWVVVPLQNKLALGVSVSF